VAPLRRTLRRANQDARHHSQDRKHHMTEHYIENEAYLAAVNAIARRWNLDVDDVKIALGEGGNFWPMSNRCDAD
jgi:hypothetical protein